MAKIVPPHELRHFLQVNGPGDPAMAWIAGRQLALVTAHQLQLAGIQRGAIASRRDRGLLHRLYRGVYLVGHSIPPPGAPELGGVLACGEGTLVSHRSAAGLWGFHAPPARGAVVTVVGRHCRSQPDLEVHRVDKMDPRDRVMLRGIPITAPARTVIDLSPELDDAELERAIAEARVLGLLSDGELEAELERAGPRPGVPKVRMIAAKDDHGLTRSEAERRMRRLIREARLPQPLTNTRLAGYEVDFLWPDQRLIVEVDGYRFHGHRSAFERDRRKAMALIASGYTVIRVTWRQLTQEPHAVVAAIASALSAASRATEYRDSIS